MAIHARLQFFLIINKPLVFHNYNLNQSVLVYILRSQKVGFHDSEEHLTAVRTNRGVRAPERSLQHIHALITDKIAFNLCDSSAFHFFQLDLRAFLESLVASVQPPVFLRALLPVHRGQVFLDRR